MRRRRLRHPVHARCRARYLTAARLVLSVLIAAFACSAPADLFHLTIGGYVEGELLDEADGKLRVRALGGTVTVLRSDVARIEQRESPWIEYERRRAETPGTPDGEVELAQWCNRRGLIAERKQHYLRAIELDPDHAAARKALGHERTDTGWIERKPQPVVESPTRGASASEAERLVATARIQWRRQITGIKSIMLESPIAERVEQGRRRILAINDPLAIDPLSEVLVRGDRDCRLLLVDVLSKFPQDDATADLALLYLLDSDGDVVDRSIRELARRKDPRVASQFRAALLVNHDGVVARAARGLGAVGDVSAVGDLIPMLTVQRDKWVETPVVGFVGGMAQTFNGPSFGYAGGRRVGAAPVIAFGRGVLANVGNVPQFRTVTVYRTEVLEALKALTGQNFGFDVDAWARWHQEQR